MEDYIQNVDILDEVKDNFLNYASEVLTDRAIPSAEDGLLSAQRKILWTMEEYLKMNAKGKTKKCASIVGTTLATSYFHGDQACYGVLCKMSLPYLMRYPLIQGQGSLGTQENNDIRASARYTEAKPSIYADLMMNDFKKNVVPLKETYNGEFMEPVVLPSFFPNALCNGKQSIGISMAHGSLPNNLTEVCNGIIAYIKNPEITIDEILNYIPGPDFPLGGTIINKKDIKTAFLTGKSNISLKVRGDYSIKDNQIIFNSLPYRAYRNKIKEQLDKKFEEFEKVLEDFSDESGLGNNRLVFTLKKGANPSQLLNKLFTYTDLQMSLSYNMNYIVNGTPKLCSIKDLIKAYYIHQTNILIAAAKFNKSKAETRLNIILGLLIALDKIDTVISIIRGAKDKNEAKEKLMATIEVNAAQADAILAMKLSQLTKMDKESLLGEKSEKENIIADCIKLIENKDYRDETLIKKVAEMRDKYGDERRTKLIDLEIPKEEKEIAAIAPEKCVVVMTKSGNIKRIAASSFKTQNRNGKGIKSQDDIVSAVIRTNTIDQLLVFSNQGKMYKILVDDIPTGTNVSKGTPITSLIKMSGAEMPSLIYSVYHETKAKYICLITRNGKIKKTSLEECLNIKKKTGVPVIKINEGDELVSVFLLDEEEILVFNENGKCLHTDTKDIAATGRTAQGVKIMESGILFAMPIRDTKDDVFIVTKDGFGKRTSLIDFNKTARTGKGVMVYKPEEHQIAGAAMVNNNDKVLISGSPCSICIDMKNINITGRTAMGVGIIKDSEVISISKV